MHLLMEEAADEMERLLAVADRRGELAVRRRREIERLRLTDAERQAIAEASDFYIGTRTGATLRGLLERTLAAVASDSSDR
jgi:hypothetical protein